MMKMVAAGLQKNSLIDYPGRVSCVVFLSGCNFACPYCHNPELVRKNNSVRISQTQLLAFLSQRRTLLDGTVITGGEPTLHPGLPELCKSIQDLGLEVKLDTNGSHPEVLAQLLRSERVNYIAMDIKTAVGNYGPPLCDLEEDTGKNSGIQAKIRQSIDLIMDGAADYEFRTTCVRPFVDADIIERITETIQGAQCYTLQTYHAAKILDPEYFQHHSPGFSPDQMARLRKLAAPNVKHCRIL